MKTVLALIISITAFASADCWGEQTPAQLCAMDLAGIPAFLLENDTGAKVHLKNPFQNDDFKRCHSERREEPAVKSKKKQIPRPMASE